MPGNDGLITRLRCSCCCCHRPPSEPRLCNQLGRPRRALLTTRPAAPTTPSLPPGPTPPPSSEPSAVAGRCGGCNRPVGRLLVGLAALAEPGGSSAPPPLWGEGRAALCEGGPQRPAGGGRGGIAPHRGLPCSESMVSHRNNADLPPTSAGGRLLLLAPPPLSLIIGRSRCSPTAAVCLTRVAHARRCWAHVRHSHRAERTFRGQSCRVF